VVSAAQRTLDGEDGWPNIEDEGNGIATSLLFFS